MVEYDLSGAHTDVENVADKVLKDYETNVKPLTSSPSYIKEDGKPAVMAFGVGIRKTVTPADAFATITQMHNSGAFFGLGTARDWAHDVEHDKGYAAAYKAADFISPWTVGVYNIHTFRTYNEHGQVRDFE